MDEVGEAGRRTKPEEDDDYLAGPVDSVGCPDGMAAGFRRRDREKDGLLERTSKSRRGREPTNCEENVYRRAGEIEQKPAESRHQSIGAKDGGSQGADGDVGIQGWKAEEECIGGMTAKDKGMEDKAEEEGIEWKPIAVRIGWNAEDEGI